MYRAMRLKEREMSREETKALLSDAEVGRLALSSENNPYVVPINFAYFKDKIYFHCAKEGQKIEYLSANSKVCFEVDEFLGIKTGPKPCNYGSKYQSVIVYGRAEFIENIDEKRLALRRLVEKYAKIHNASFDEKIFDKTLVVAINVEKITGKRQA